MRTEQNIISDHPVLHFPRTAKDPEDEYDGVPIFSNAFPWLFPGGVGDINYSKKKEYGYVQKWASTMVHYYDGRFVRDNTWCFYALNYVQRRAKETGSTWRSIISRQVDLFFIENKRIGFLLENEEISTIYLGILAY